MLHTIKMSTARVASAKAEESKKVWEDLRKVYKASMDRLVEFGARSHQGWSAWT